MLHTKKRGGLTKVATGIQGFDDITGGGLPEDRTTLVMGGPGSGKTVFALQTLVTGASRGEPGILVTFQESPRQLIEDAAAFGWNLGELEKDKLVILDARIRPSALKSIELYLTGMLAGIKLVSGEVGARRIVFDSLDALLSLLGDRTAERHEMFRVRDWLLEADLTAIVTAQVENDDPFTSQRHSFMQFMADCVVNLQHHPGKSTSSRSLRVLKYRGSGFAEDEFPVRIGGSGLEVGHHSGVALVRSSARTIQQELDEAKGQLRDRLESLNRQVEIKKTELEFLLKTGAKRLRKVRNTRAMQTVKPRRAGSKRRAAS